MTALLEAQKRGLLPTTLGTAELRELGGDILARSVFTARGSSAAFVSVLKGVVDAMAGGEMDDATARVTLLEMLKVLGYTPEGGFPDAPAGAVPPALAGTLQDLSSYRRLQLIVETQRGLMVGAGQKSRGTTPERLELFPAWELVRVLSVAVPRDWPSRWAIAGGELYAGRMIAAKGDPVWGELGNHGNFQDALGVDFPPFCFNSGMGWQEISKQECARLRVTGPGGKSLAAFHASQPATLSGRQALPAPTLSTRDLDPDLARRMRESTGATEVAGTLTLPGGEDELARRAAARAARQQERMERDVAEAKAAYEGRSR